MFTRGYSFEPDLTSMFLLTTFLLGVDRPQTLAVTNATINWAVSQTNCHFSWVSPCCKVAGLIYPAICGEVFSPLTVLTTKIDPENEPILAIVGENFLSNPLFGKMFNVCWRVGVVIIIYIYIYMCVYDSICMCIYIYIYPSMYP